jgi:hypothetical protein
VSLETIKSVATAAVLALALLQGLEMAQIKGWVRLLPFGKAALRRFHRRGGVAALILTAAVATTCIIGEGYSIYSLRVWVHAVAGSLAIWGMVTKVIITHRARRLLRVNETLGGLIGLLILTTFLASVVWYYLLV